MKSLLVVLTVLLLLTSFSIAQQASSDPGNFYAVGATYNPGATPSVAGTAIWAHRIADNDGKTTYAFTAFDALPSSLKPFTVSTNVSVGVAQKLVTIGKFPIYIPIAGGPSFTGQNAGYNWNTGAMSCFNVKGSFGLCPNVRFTRNNVDGSGDVHPMVGVLLSWGQ